MADAKTVPTPELDKQHAVIHGEEAPSDTMTAFYDWMQQHHLVLARWTDGITEQRERVCPDCNGSGFDVDRLTSRQRQLRAHGIPPEEIPGRLPACERCDGSCTIWVDVKVGDTELVPDHRPPEQLLADFFGIDRDKIEDERRALLEAIRR